MIAIIFSSETPGLDNSDPHAALKARYEADAQLYTAAWELWQRKASSMNDWVDCREPLAWCVTTEYRRKKHADLMIQYGNEIGDKPWEHWEHKTTLSEQYVPCSVAPFWDDETEYRRKVSTASYAAAIPGAEVEQAQPGAGHPHAELMIQYGEESKTNPRAWENWQYKSTVEWRGCGAVPNWNPQCEYRRKPEVILINGIEVPKPLTKAPEKGTLIHVVRLSKESGSISWYWQGDTTDKETLNNGLVHLTEEAAAEHARALLSFTKAV